MIKITIYKSFDGKKFYNREDCIDYEIETLKTAADYIKYLGELGSIVYPEDIGFWCWDDHIGKYRHITDDEVTRLERKLELIKKYR